MYWRARGAACSFADCWESDGLLFVLIYFASEFFDFLFDFGFVFRVRIEIEVARIGFQRFALVAFFFLRFTEQPEGNSVARLG